MANYSQTQDLASGLKLTGRQMGRIAEDDLIFRATVDAFRAEDAGSFGRLLERFELSAYCEEICRWICVKECVIECIEMCGPPKVEFTEAQVPEFAAIIARITRDPILVDRLAEAVAERDAKAYHQLLEELEIVGFCHVLCFWACGVRCARRCQVICDSPVLDRQEFSVSLTTAGAAVGKLAEDKVVLSQFVTAAINLNCEILQKAVGDLPGCTWICAWICSWRCAIVCLPLARAYPPSEDLSIEEERSFALALARVAEIEDAFPRLLASVQARNSDSFARLLVEYKLEPYALQLCAWICSEICNLFCRCVCPPAGIAPMFTAVGNYNIGPTPNDFNPNGTTLVGALAFTGSIDLNGSIPDGDETPQDIEYQFTYQQIYPSLGNVENVTGAMIEQTKIGILEYWYWEPFILPIGWRTTSTPVYVNNPNVAQQTVSIRQPVGPSLVQSTNVVPDADGWIPVPTWNDFSPGGYGVFKATGTLVTLDTTQLTDESFDLTAAGPGLPLLAGDTPPAGVLSKMPVFAINFQARNVTTHASVGANTLDAIALSNTSYTYNRHPEWPGSLPPVVSPVILSVDIVQLVIAGGCSDLNDTIYALYTAYHPYLASCELYLQGPNTSGMTTPPGGQKIFSIQPNQGQVIGTGNNSALGFSGTLTTPVLPNSVRVTAGSVVAFDNGTGGITGSGITSGTIDYTTGAISINYSSHPATGVQVLVSYDTLIASSIPPTESLVLGTGNGSTLTFAGTLTTPVLPGSVQVTADTVVGLDDEAGTITGSGITAGSINYGTGAASVSYTVAPAAGKQVVVEYDLMTTPLTPFDMSNLPKCAYILWLNATLNLTNGTTGVNGTFSDYMAFCTT